MNDWDLVSLVLIVLTLLGALAAWVALRRRRAAVRERCDTRPATRASSVLPSQTDSSLEQRFAEEAADESSARMAAQLRAAIQYAQADAQRRASEELARLQAERREAAVAARLESERRAQALADRVEAERLASEEAVREADLQRAASGVPDAATWQRVEPNEVKPSAPTSLVPLSSSLPSLEMSARLALPASAPGPAPALALALALAPALAPALALTPVPQRQPQPLPPMPPLNRRPQDIAVLVADDSKVVRVKTSRVLAKHQFRIVLAEDGQEAWRQIQAAPVDVLITAAGMPGLDGFELTRRVRANPLTAQMQVIMVTAADEQLRTRAADAGANLLLGKPYDDAALIAHIFCSLNLSTATN